MELVTFCPNFFPFFLKEKFRSTTEVSCVPFLDSIYFVPVCIWRKSFPLFYVFAIFLHITVYKYLEKEMATHSSILAWKNPMDRGAWQATVHGVARAGHSLATKPPTLRLSSEEWPSVSHELQGYLYMKGPRAQTLLHQHQCYMTVQHRVRI